MRFSEESTGQHRRRFAENMDVKMLELNREEINENRLQLDRDIHSGHE
jgi:hypothetical protein